MKPLNYNLLRAKLKLLLLCSLTVAAIAVAKPKILSNVMPSAWGVDETGALSPLPLIWGWTNGVWLVESDGSLVMTTNRVKQFGFFWEQDTNGVVILK